jgi:pimeloyl-ACP methyl ester carboxylesterase
MANRPDYRITLRTSNFPVVMIHRTADEIIPIEHARENRDGLNHHKLFEIEGAGHVPMLEVPQATAEA